MRSFHKHGKVIRPCLPKMLPMKSPLMLKRPEHVTNEQVAQNFKQTASFKSCDI